MKAALVRSVLGRAVLAVIAATTMATVVGSSTASAAPAAKSGVSSVAGPAAPTAWTPIAAFATRPECEAARSQVPYPSFCVGVITGGYVLWADV
ncbi:hypothetical protein ACHBTE_30005 [Streptomyces sp. M41]|uniref:hypothetical protein n=1 Tax=Streptomyces sp. M41 TaxID=3059412 RepID=UPI00374D73E0